MTTVAGIVETVGNAAAFAAASMWARVAWQTGVRVGAALLASIAVWAACGVFYGLAYIGRTRGWWEWWDTTPERAAEMVQQATQVATPIVAIALLARFVRDRRVLAR